MEKGGKTWSKTEEKTKGVKLGRKGEQLERIKKRKTGRVGQKEVRKAKAKRKTGEKWRYEP